YDLLQLYSITENRAEADVEVDLENDALSANLAAQQCRRVPDRVVDVERHSRRRRFPRHLADALHHAAGAMGISRDSRRRSCGTADIGRVARKPGSAGASSRGDSRQRLAHFMCNQAGQLANRSEPRSMSKIRLGRL